MLLCGDGHLHRVLGAYLEHYNRERNHQRLENALIGGRATIGSGPFEGTQRVVGSGSPEDGRTARLKLPVEAKLDVDRVVEQYGTAL